MYCTAGPAKIPWRENQGGLDPSAPNGKAVITQRRARLLAVGWKVGPPLKPVPARAGGRVPASEAGFVQLSGLSLPAALKKNH